MAGAGVGTVALHTGARMPLLGLGTWQAGGPDAEMAAGLDAALEEGYRHIDTAALYRNEAVVGDVLQRWYAAGRLRREDLFLVGKLPPVGMRPERVQRYLLRTLDRLRTGYLDLYLIHLPYALQETPAGDMFPVGPDGQALIEFDTDHVAIWKAMEAQVATGRVRALGLSNFTERQIQRVLDNCHIRPANLQVELHARIQQRHLVDFCHRNGIVVTAFSPLGSPGSEAMFKARGHPIKIPDILYNPTIKEIGDKHKKTAAQILLRHIIQRGIVAVPKSNRRERLIENIHIFDFELSEDEMEKINALDQGREGLIFDSKFIKGIEKHPEYPF